MTTAPLPIPPRLAALAERRATLIACGVVFVVALALARSAMLPGIWFWDTAEAQIVGPTLGVMHPTGFPAYVVLGWIASTLLAPFGEPAFRMNLLSGILVAVAAASTVAIVRRLGGPITVAALAGLGFASTPVAWRMATQADVHALHVALVGIVVLLLVGWERAWRERAVGLPGRRPDRWLLAAAAATGVSLANHQLTLLLAPAIAAFVLAVDPGVLRRPRFVAACLLLPLAVAALLYLELPLRAGPFRAPLVYGHPETLEGMRYVILAEQFRSAFEDPFADPVGTLVATTVRLLGQLGPLLALVPVAFVVTVLRRPAYALLSGVAVLVTLAFNAGYQNADIGRYDLGPLLLMWTWLGILAWTVVDAVVERLYGPPDDAIDAADAGDEADDRDPAEDRDPADDVPALSPELRARAVAGLGLLVAAVLLLPTVATFDERYRAVDRSQDRSARTWLDHAFAVLPRDAVVVSWWSYSTPLWYGQLIEGRRPDIRVIDDRTRLDEGLGEVNDVIDAQLGRAPVFVMRALPHELAAVEARFQLRLVEGTDVLYEVVGERAASR